MKSDILKGGRSSEGCGRAKTVSQGECGLLSGNTGRLLTTPEQTGRGDLGLETKGWAPEACLPVPHDSTATRPGRSKSAENKGSFGISDILFGSE